MTHTYVLMELSPAAYDEIAAKMRAAGYDHTFNHEGEIDMHGIAVTRCPATLHDIAITREPTTFVTGQELMGFKILIDRNALKGTIEFRDADGRLVGRITGISS